MYPTTGVGSTRSEPPRLRTSTRHQRADSSTIGKQNTSVRDENRTAKKCSANTLDIASMMASSQVKTLRQAEHIGQNVLPLS